MINRVNEWNDSNVKHLLSRTMYGFKREDVDLALSISMDDFIDNYLLSNVLPPPPPNSWVNELPSENDTAGNLIKYIELGSWHYELMRTESNSLRERMVNFFTNHFVSEAEKVEIPHYQYIQNKLFREYAFGNFKELTKKITIDPAMLIYLDGVFNTKYEPNENYGRELLELFTIGIGNYTEQDIRNAARALAGWTVEGLTSSFDPDQGDTGQKEFMGQTGNFNYTDIVDIVFTKDETAKFICRKLYKEFVYYKPDEAMVEELAEIFRNNNYELKPVLSAMFKSAHFYSTEFKATKIKSPDELIVGAFKQFNLESIHYLYIGRISDKLQQLAFSPPDVRGWEGQRKWISTSTIPIRSDFTDSIFTGKSITEQTDENPTGKIYFKVDVLEFARTFESSENAEQFVNEVIDYLIHFPLNQNAKNRMLQTLLDGSAKEDWSTYNDGAEDRLIKFFKTLTRLPEYHLI